MHVSRKNKQLIYKLVGLLSIVRGYNLLVIVVAQYLTSIFILSQNQPVFEVLTELKLFTLIFSSALAIASGYIINSFYDSEKDLINRPQKTKLDRLVSQRTKLSIYFLLNFIAVIIASYNSFKAVCFISFYIFLIWLYSHKLKRIPIWGNITSTGLAIFPFFVVFLYYQNYDWVIFGHAQFLALIIFMREIAKDLENLSGDMALGYLTIPIKYGEKATKYVLQVLIIITIAVTIILITRFSLGKMDYYFAFSIVALLVFNLLLFRAVEKKHYLGLHNILKVIVVIGVLSIVLIDPN